MGKCEHNHTLAVVGTNSADQQLEAADKINLIDFISRDNVSGAAEPLVCQIHPAEEQQ